MNKLAVSIIHSITRIARGILVFVFFKPLVNNTVGRFDSPVAKIIGTILMFVLCAWAVCAIMEVINIPAYIAHVKRGCDPEPIIRVRLIDLIPMSATKGSLTIDTDTRWQINEITSAVKKSWKK
jgi:hypothetical protein